MTVLFWLLFYGCPRFPVVGGASRRHVCEEQNVWTVVIYIVFSLLREYTIKNTKRGWGTQCTSISVCSWNANQLETCDIEGLV